MGPSCVNTPDCNDESCCTSLLVEGGTHERGATDGPPATVSSYCLDKYEVTVGRFREFLQAYDDEWRPTAGDGAHPVAEGTGWQDAWTMGYLQPQVGPFKASLDCHEAHTWVEPAGTTSEENRPINCVSWYEAFAFCIWDGGRLPTEAEWEYAAAGGDEERTYPWGPEAPDVTRASYDCLGDGSGYPDCTIADILAVGSLQPEGNGRWGHSDLAGNMWEWNFDWYATDFPESCTDCANTTTATWRVQRGGCWRTGAVDLPAAYRSFNAPYSRYYTLGFRCARAVP